MGLKIKVLQSMHLVVRQTIFLVDRCSRYNSLTIMKWPPKPRKYR